MKIINYTSGMTHRKLGLETRLGNSIENSQAHTIPEFESMNFDKFDNGFREPEVIRRTNPSPFYNCHGLTFASRRTAISETEEVNKILREDNYEDVELKDVLPGDIVLYIDNQGFIEHSGIVITEPEAIIHMFSPLGAGSKYGFDFGEIKDILKMPKVISKWRMYCECIHYAHFCPYNATNLKFVRIKQ